MNNIKGILSQIIRAKRATKEYSILFVNQTVYDSFEEAGLVIHWEENHPGATWTHCDICGLPVIIDQKEELFSVVPLYEARERIISTMF